MGVSTISYRYIPYPRVLKTINIINLLWYTLMEDSKNDPSFVQGNIVLLGDSILGLEY